MNPNNPNPHDAMVEELLAKATPRPSAPEDDREAIFQEVRQEWVTLGRSKRKRQRFAVVAALAASIAALVIAFIPNQTDNAPKVEVAALMKGNASISYSDDGEFWQPVAKDPIWSGNHVRTSGKGGLFAIAAGGNLRLKAYTHVVFLSPSHIRLESGSVYFDSEAKSPPVKLTISTQDGTIRNIGTQFTVNFDQSRTQVRVRSGEVSWNTSNAGLTRLKARQSGTLSSSGKINIETISPCDEHWGWVDALTPAYDPANKKIVALLEWFARETGRSLEFETSQARSIAYTETLKVKINTATLDELNPALATAELVSHFVGETIVVSELP